MFRPGIPIHIPIHILTCFLTVIIIARTKQTAYKNKTKLLQAQADRDKAAAEAVKLAARAARTEAKAVKAAAREDRHLAEVMRRTVHIHNLFLYFP